MFDWLRNAYRSLVGGSSSRLALPSAVGMDAYADMSASSTNSAYQVNYRWDEGSKFEGGLGPIELLLTDYWALRARSAEMFERNLYARGLIRRLVTNEIHTGLNLSATPEEVILGLEEGALSSWSEEIENRFSLWASDPWLCDVAEQHSFGALQQLVRQEALVTGDVLVVVKQFQATRLPRIQIINGAKVQTPVGRYELPNGNRIVWGVELDSQNRQVAYHVMQPDGTSQRVAAYGSKTGRRSAWLVYGTDKRLDDVRGRPILSLVLQSLKEIDRYRDATQRKALVNSMLAMFVKKTVDKPGSKPMGQAAVRKGTETGSNSLDDRPRRFNVAEGIPGVVIDELQQGEEPQGFASNGTDERFGGFEEAIIQAVAWANEIPPEILTLGFGSNYSASQAAINEFKIYISKVRTTFGEQFCQPIYIEWLLSEALQQKIKAPRLIESFRDSKLYDVFAAWTSCDWAGAIKVAVDLSKLVAGYKALVAEGWITRDRAARELTGMKFAKVVQTLEIENEKLAKANRVLVALDPKVLAAEVAAGDQDVDHESTDAEDEPAQKPTKLPVKRAS